MKGDGTILVQGVIVRAHFDYFIVTLLGATWLLSLKLLPHSVR